MIKNICQTIALVISKIITRSKQPEKKIKEVVNVKYSMYKKAS